MIKNWKLKIGNSQRGFSLVEVVIGTALIALALVGLAGAFSFYLKVGLKNTDALKGAFLAEEGVEAVTLLRDASWSNLSLLATGTPYYLSWNGSAWVATTTPALIDGIFTRTITLGDLYRRTSDKDIVATSSPDAKTLDTDIKQVTVRVTAAGVDTSLQTYLANIFK